MTPTRFAGGDVSDPETPEKFEMNPRRAEPTKMSEIMKLANEDSDESGHSDDW